MGGEVREEHDLRAALRDADWPTLMERLANYAERRLRWTGWITDRKTAAHTMTPYELVNHAVDRCIEGKRHWYKDAGYPNLESFLRWVIRSLLSTEIKADARDRADFADDGIVEGNSDEPSPEDAVADRERTAVTAAVEACVDGDDDLEAFYMTVLDGHVRREDIAETLGWTAERASAARVKLQRRLLAKHPDLFGSSKKVRTA
jgi:hypothetical protein